VFNAQKGSYDFDLFDTDEKILSKVQTGKGDPLIYEAEGYFISV